MKKIILITDDYNNNEEFIKPELSYLLLEFDVTIISSSDIVDDKIYVNNHCVRHIKVNHVFNLTFTIFDILKIFVKKEILTEIYNIFKSRVRIIFRLKNSIEYYLAAQNFYRFLKRNKLLNKNTNAIFYTYWFNSRTLALSLNRKKHPNIKLITRVHGYDLYNERNKFGRQQFKPLMDANIDKIVFVSSYGKEYYLNAFNISSSLEKYVVHKLGVINNFGLNPFKKSSIFNIVSCSNLIELKRVDLIIRGLSEIENFSVNWTHFGDGVKANELIDLANKLLSKKQNITYVFKGFTPNEEIHHYYQNNSVDCFITTSSTEGCPVSIQEALSYGIPIIGTNVGGIPETINNNGILLNRNPTSKEISEAMASIYYSPTTTIETYRLNSRNLWSELYNPDINHRNFVKSLMNL